MNGAAMNTFLHIFLVHKKLFVIENIPMGVVVGRLSDVCKISLSRH